MSELHYKILESGGSIFHGSTILKSMQNDSVSPIDLLVREAIQNSNDAAIDIGEKYYSVSFHTGNLDAYAFNSLFPENIRNELNSRKLHNDFIEIRDTKTCGLSGGTTAKIKSKEKHGHFAKLVYDCGIEQEEETSGGSWGFGKSVYYRTSAVGIVIFYSRTKVNDKLESRLIVTLVENERDEQSLLDKQNAYAAGKAWFGDKDPISGSDEVLPIVDEARIAEILSFFNLAPFGTDESGTSVIIPYIDKQELLSSILPKDTEDADEDGNIGRLISADDRASYTWATDFEEYLRLCIQKWYAPKLQNADLVSINAKFLKASVNGIALRNDNLSADYKTHMRPFFKAVQELYTAAYAAASGYDNFSPKKSTFSGITTKPVVVRNYCDGGEKIGYVATLKVQKQIIDQGGTDPYAFLRKFTPAERKNSVILMYTREPGMVIDYMTSGDWVSGIPNEDSDDHYLLAFFVPSTEKTMKNENHILPKFRGGRLGKYLKACEVSDHMAWKDRDGMWLVERLKSSVQRTVKEVVAPQPPAPGTDDNCKLAISLGRTLLSNLSKKSNRNSKTPAGEPGGKLYKDFVFRINGTRFVSEGEMAIAFESTIPSTLKSFVISINVEAENSWLSPEKWKKSIGITFPFTFSKHQAGDPQSRLALTSLSETQLQVTTDAFGELHQGEILISATDRKYRFKLVTLKETEDKNDGK